MTGSFGRHGSRGRWFGGFAIVLTILLSAPSAAGAPMASPGPSSDVVFEVPPSGEDWPACDDVRTQYCVSEFTIDGVDMLHSTEWRIGVNSLFWDPPEEGPMSFNWYLQAWDAGWQAPPDGWRGYVTVGINSGQIVPRWTQGYGDGFSLNPGGDEASGYTIRADGYPIDMHWLSLDDWSCSAGLGCGDESTRADVWTTMFGGNTQDMHGWDRSFADPAGMWIVTDAQFMAFPFLEVWPEPHWVIQLGNVHLKADGTPVEGVFTAYMPPATMTDNHVSVDEALTFGVRVTRTDGSEMTVIGGSVERFDDGLLIRLPLEYSRPMLGIYPRPGTRLPMPPSAPRSVTGTAVDGGAVMRFKAPTSTGGSPIAGYTAVCEYGEELESERAIVGVNPVAIQVAVPNGVEASCKVRATNAAGKFGPWSYPVLVTPTATLVKPGAPVLVSGTAKASGAIDLSWKSPASLGGAGSILDYKVSVCPANQNCVTRGTITTRSIVLPAAQLPTGWYTVRVQARTTEGLGDVGALLGPSPVPSAPAVSSSVATGRNFQLTWAAPTGGKFPMGTTYDVWTAKNGGAWMPFVSGLRSRSVVFPATYGNTYRFKVEAVSSAGAHSATRAAVTTVVPFDDKADGMTWSSGWTKFSSPSRFGAAAHRTSKAGATLTFRSTGTRIWLVGDRGVDNGRFRVRIDGKAWSPWISTRASATRTRQILWASGTLSDAAHTIKVVAEGTAGHPKVVIDAIGYRR